MVMPTRIETHLQLLVEGNDERNFFQHFCQHLSLKNVEVHGFGGVNNFKRYLPAFVNIPGFDNVARLGIVRDAEQSATSALQSIQSVTKNAGLSPPDHVQKFTEGTPAVGVLVLPGGDQNGMLETLLCQTFADSPENACIDEFFNCLENQANLSLKRPDKSRAYAFLSTKEFPQSSVGVAAQKDYWNLDHDALANVRNFLTELAS